MEWIISSNPKYYDIDRAFRKLGSIEWQTKCNIQKGDICYIYLGYDTKAIRYKCIAISDIRNVTTIDDSYYGGNPTGVEYRCVEIKPIGYYAGKGITYENLKEHGLKFSIRSPIRAVGELGDYIKESCKNKFTIYSICDTMVVWRTQLWRIVSKQCYHYWMNVRGAYILL